LPGGQGHPDWGGNDCVISTFIFSWVQPLGLIPREN
jgi:hypothetical protein